MWGRLCLFWMFTWTVLAASPITLCPEDCECSPSTRSGISAHCYSLDFINKLRPKQIREINELHVRGMSIRSVDRKLKKLKNLTRLDLQNNRIENLDNFPQLQHLTHLNLGGNRIESLKADRLPTSIKHLDLSSNLIRSITKDLVKHLPNLHELNLNGNPLTCDCDFVKNRDYFLRNRVHIVRPANCYNPENVRDASLLSVYCVSGLVTYDDLGQMLGDDPGSGEDVQSFVSTEAPSLNPVYDATEDVNKDIDELEEGYIKVVEEIDSKSDEESVDGSGDGHMSLFMGSGDGELVTTEAELITTEGESLSPNPSVPHCYFDCSTEAAERERNSTEPSASAKDVIESILPGIADESTTTEKNIIKEAEVKEATVTVSKVVPNEQSGGRANIEAPKESQTTENVAKKDNTTTYVVVGVLFVAMLALVIFVVMRKRKSRGPNRRPVHNHDIKEPSPVEMKPLMSPIKPSLPQKSPLPERTPLVNGQNGTNKKEETPKSDEPGKTENIPVENGLGDVEDDEPELRPKKDEGALLTPGTKRVTIQAMELSSPKSPVLVHRHVGNDGKIVSSPISNEFKYT